MKKITFALSVVLLAATAIVINGCGEDETVPVVRTVIIPKDQKGLLAQDYPDMLTVAVTKTLAEQLINAAHTNLHLNSVEVNPFVTQINATALTWLKSTANALSCNPACVDWITAVRITYGQVGSNLITYFQPVYMCADGATYTTTAGVRVRNYDLCAEGQTYTVSSAGDFELVNGSVPNTVMQTNIALYRTPKTSMPYGVEVRDPAGNLQDFKETADQDYTGHAKAVIFPIDELINIASITGKAKLWSVVDGLKLENDDFPHAPINKHDLLISTGDVTYSGTTVSIPGAAKFADLSNICPPSCNGKYFTFRIQ